MNLPGYIEQINIDLLGTDLSRFRLINDDQLKRMKESLVGSGMLQPVVVCKKSGAYQIIDGFKRYYASCELNLKELSCRVLDINTAEGKALIISCNRENCKTVDYEEAKIVYSLKTEDGLSGQEISVLLNQSASWVSRRLSLIEKLDSQVQEHIKLGLLSHSHAREIIKLPRGNQEEISKCIINHRLNTRCSNMIVEAYLKAKNKQQQSYILTDPGKVIESLTKKEDTSYDHRLSKEANKILRTLDILHRQGCILFGQLSCGGAQNLAVQDKMILLPRFKTVIKNSERIISSIKKYTGK